MIKAGDLDRRLVLLAPMVTKDAAHAPVTTWVEGATIHAAKYELRAVEVQREAGKAAQSELKFLIRYRTGLDTTMRLALREAVYAITGIQEIGRREGMWVFARSVA